MNGLRFVHPPRTGGTSIRLAWRLSNPEYRGHTPPAGEAFRYGFTRNPWDRMISIYHLVNPRGEHSFRQWLLGGIGSHVSDGLPLWWPTTYWLDGCVFVGRFEHRERDLKCLARMLGRAVPDVHHGRTERAPYESYYDDETRETVAVLMKADIERFGYAFGG